MMFISRGISPPKPPDRRTRWGGFLVLAVTDRALFSTTDERENSKNTSQDATERRGTN